MLSTISTPITALPVILHDKNNYYSSILVKTLIP